MMNTTMNTTTSTTTMTTDRNERIAALAAKRSPRMTTKRQATIGKILATGLTSTTVFGITATLGWSASAASDDSADQVVFDQATGIITTYRNGQVLSSAQVAQPATTPGALAVTATAPAVTPPPSVALGFPPAAPAITPAPAPQSPGKATNTETTVAPVASADSSTEIPVVTVTPTAQVPVVVAAPIDIPIEIPVAIPAPRIAPPPPQGSSSGSS